MSMMHYKQTVGYPCEYDSVVRQIVLKWTEIQIECLNYTFSWHFDKSLPSNGPGNESSPSNPTETHGI